MLAKKTIQRATTKKTPSALEAGKGVAANYHRSKEYKGRRYTGMTIGRTHHWYYDKADWKEKKVTPAKWEFTYSTTKRRHWHC
jgi:uncharacterized protein (DUF2252 family)